MAALLFQFTSDLLAAHQLETDPIGWDSLKWLWARDPKRHGVMLSVSVDLTFSKQAAAYLRLLYEGGTDAQGRPVAAQGVAALVVLTVFEQDPNELRPVEIYRGQLDFLTYVSEERGVTCRFKEVGFATALLARADTAVDLLGNESLSGVSLPPYPPVTATLHSQQTRQRYEGRVVTTALETGSGTVYDDNSQSQLFYFGYNEVSNEIGLQQIAGGFVPGNAYEAVPIFTAPDTGEYVIELGGAVELTVNNIGDPDAGFGAFDVKFHYRINGTPGTPTIANGGLLATAGPALPAGGLRVTIPARRFTEQLVPGDKIYLYAEVYLHQISDPFLPNYQFRVNATEQVGTYLRIQATTTTPATACAGLLVHEVLARCCEAATDQRDALYSEYYGHPASRVPYAQAGPGARRLTTSGFQLRGFPLPDAPLGTGVTDTRKSLACSLNEAYDSLDAVDCLGMGTEQRAGRPVVRIEPRAHFYQATEVVRLGAVTGLKKSPYAEWLYNEAQVGYQHWQSGSANGLDEFNGLRTYALPLGTVKKTYAAISRFNAAGYLIEEARRNRYGDGTTKEGQADSELFLICVRFVPAHTEVVLGVTTSYPDTYVSEQGEAFTLVQGVLSPTAYNLRLSPGRMLRNHGPWLRAGLATLTSKRLLLTKSAGNDHLVSRRTGETSPLEEGADVAVSELAAPLVLAETYAFTARLRRGQMKALEANPYGRISFLDSFGTRKSGHLLRAERTPQGGLTTFTLLRAA